jgi:hypothetical protein
MSSDGSVTHWVHELRAGNRAAAQRLWEGYFRRLVVLARQRLAGSPRRAADEEDVALSAFDSFCRGAELNRFPRLEDRNDLWQLLVVLTARKALDLRQHERRQKRGGGAVRGESVFAGLDGAGWSRSSAPSRPRSSPPRWPTSVAACSTASTLSCARSPWRRWKGSPTPRLPPALAAPPPRSSGGCG